MLQLDFPTRENKVLWVELMPCNVMDDTNSLSGSVLGSLPSDKNPCLEMQRRLPLLVHPHMCMSTDSSVAADVRSKLNRT